MRWNETNGWDSVFSRAGDGVPGLSPYWLTAQISLPASADFATSVSGSTEIIVTPESEFYIIGAVAGGWAPGVGTEGLGSVPLESPDCYPATVLIREDSGGRTLSAGPCSIGHLFGGGCRPYLWPAPWRVQPGTGIQVTLEHRFTTAQDVWLTFIGFKRYLTDPPFPVDFLVEPRLVRTLAKYRASGRNVQPEPYFYPLAFSGVTARAPNQSEQRTFSVTEADFALCHLAGAVSDPFNGTSWVMEADLDDNIHVAGTGGVVGRGVAQETIRLITGIGRVRLDDRPVGIGAIMGTGRKIGRYASPLVIPRNDSLTALVQFKDSTAGSNIPLRGDFTFGGARLIEV